VPIFIETAQKVFENSTSTQKTLNNYMEYDTPEMLKTSITTRMVNFIHKIGPSFLIGLTEFITQLTQDHRTLTTEFKGILREYLVSAHSKSLFPEWFDFLDVETRFIVIDNLLSKIP
jgi:hypothetical protein